MFTRKKSLSATVIEMEDRAAADVLGQQPLLRIYTQLCFCFFVDSNYSLRPYVQYLEAGLERLYAAFPRLSCQVVNEGLNASSSGVFRIVDGGNIPRLVVKDLQHDPSQPTMETLQAARLPFSMLDESILAPRRTLPSPQESESEQPVFMIQATFIVGGLLLTFLGQHNAMDATGLGQAISLFSKACRDEPFTAEEIANGNMCGADINSSILTGESYPSDAADEYVIAQSIPPVSTSTSAIAISPNCLWVYLNFPSTSLTNLKSLAIADLPPDTPFISTDDTITAFIYRSILRARRARLPPGTTSTLARAVDVRSHLHIPSTYPGLMQNLIRCTFDLHEAASWPLGKIAAQLRSTLNKRERLADATRALAAKIVNSPDQRSSISFTANMDFSKDVAISSWTKLRCYEWDFGSELGKAEAVRRPRFDPVESLLYVMPKTLEGEIAVTLCLREEDLELMKGDEEVERWAQLIV